MNERFEHITSLKPGTVSKRYYHLFNGQNNRLYSFDTKFDAMQFAHITFGEPVTKPTSLKSFIAKRMIWLPAVGGQSRFDGDTFIYTGPASSNHGRLDIWHFIQTEEFVTVPTPEAIEKAREFLGIPPPYTPIPDEVLQIQVVANFFTFSGKTEATGKASGLRWLTTLELQQYIELYAQRFLIDLIDPEPFPRYIDQDLILVVALALGFQAGFKANSSNKDYRLISALGGVAVPFPLSGAVFDYANPSYINSVPARIKSNRPKSEPRDKRFMPPKHDIKADIALWRRIEAESHS